MYIISINSICISGRWQSHNLATMSLRKDNYHKTFKRDKAGALEYFREKCKDDFSVFYGEITKDIPDEDFLRKNRVNGFLQSLDKRMHGHSHGRHYYEDGKLKFAWILTKFIPEDPEEEKDDDDSKYSKFAQTFTDEQLTTLEKLMCKNCTKKVLLKPVKKKKKTDSGVKFLKDSSLFDSCDQMEELENPLEDERFLRAFFKENKEDEELYSYV